MSRVAPRRSLLAACRARQPRPRAFRIRLLRGGATLVAAGFLAIVALVAAAPDPGPLLAGSRPAAIEIVDRHGTLLRLLPDGNGERFREVGPGRLAENLVHAVLAAEDKRFFRHPGVDPVALARAALQDVRARRVVSGGSTLSMQLARILDPRPRGVAAKLAQIGLALRLELAYSKPDILRQYLARAPLGNRVVGFEAAARVYFGKPAGQLSPAEAALLAAVPRAPSRANPWHGATDLRARRDLVLARMHALGFVDTATLLAAVAEPVVLAADPFRWQAPHAVARVLAEIGTLPAGATRIVTTIEPVLQARVESIVRWQLDALATHGVDHLAVVVLDLGRSEWIAIEGSGGFFDRPGGQQDGSRAPRQPGSALKPFTYALAFDRGCSPATLLADLPTSFVWGGGTWTPRNYDERFHGPLTARQALACSVNVPAAVLLERVGVTRLLATLHAAGITTLTRDAAAYGLGLTLGSGEVRLDELTAAFGALLRGGEWRQTAAWRTVRDDVGHTLRRNDPGLPRRICSPEAAAQVVDVLADPEARAAAFGAHGALRLPFAAAVKTGTSESFRDNWCVGGTREVVVGVWAGNFDRTPMGNVSGVTGAGAVWRETMLAWAELAYPGRDLASLPGFDPLPATLTRIDVCALSGERAGARCPRTVAELLHADAGSRPGCSWHRRPDGGVVWPPLFADWAAKEGLIRAEPVPRTPGTTTGASAAELEILSPANGDTFVLTPDLPSRFQTLPLACAAGPALREVVWFVDDQPFARTAFPFRSTWALEPGTHRIEARAGTVSSREVEVTVLDGRRSPLRRE